MKVRLTLGNFGCGCKAESVDLEYNGTKEEVVNDDNFWADTVIDALLNRFKDHYLDIEYLSDDNKN